MQAVTMESSFSLLSFAYKATSCHSNSNTHTQHNHCESALASHTMYLGMEDLEVC